MPFPNLLLKADPTRPTGVALHYAEAEGVPDSGLNIVGIPFVAAGINPDKIQAGFLQVFGRPLADPSSVTGVLEGVHPTPVEPGSFLSADKTQIALSFVQTGADAALIQVKLVKTEER